MGGDQSSVLQGWPFWGIGRYNYGVFQADSDSKISGEKKKPTTTTKKKHSQGVSGVAMSQPDWTPGNSSRASGERGVLPCTVHMVTAMWLEGSLALGGGGAACLSPDWV